MVDPLTLAAQFGPFVFLAVLFFVSYKELVGKLVSVIQNNTEAITRLSSSSQATCDDLAQHDRRVQDMAGVVNRIDGTVGRIETQLGEVHKEVTRRGNAGA